MTGFLPYGRQSIDQSDIDAVVAVLKSDWLTNGPAVSALETDLTRQFGGTEAVAVSNGTTALHLAAQSLGVGPGDWAVVPSVSFVATANAIRYLGGDVVFADVDSETGLITAESCEKACQSAGGPVRAILPVHLGGRLAPLPDIAEIAKKYGAKVISDSCHALGGCDRDGNRVGSCTFASMETFSFHPVKTIAAGEGGAVACADADLASRVRLLRSHGITRDPSDWHDHSMRNPEGTGAPWYYEMTELGHNFRISDIQCALAKCQLAKLENFVSTRDRLAQRYDAAFSEAKLRHVLPVPRDAAGGGAWHLYQVAIDFQAAGKPRQQVMSELKALGVGTQVHYIPIHMQPYYRSRYGSAQLPGAEMFYSKALSLPLFPSMPENAVERVVEALKSVLS